MSGQLPTKTVLENNKKIEPDASSDTRFAKIYKPVTFCAI